MPVTGPQVVDDDPAAAAWGLHAFEDPRRTGAAARPVWRREVHARVLVADAGTLGAERDLFDLARFAPLATVARSTAGTEHVLLSDGHAALRIDLGSGTLLAGPACLAFRLSGLAALHAPLEALRDLLRLARSGRLRPGYPADRNRRQILLLRAADGLRAGATQRELAAVLLSEEACAARWRTEAPSLRSRAQRLAQGARAMAGGGYRTLLAG